MKGYTCLLVLVLAVVAYSAETEVTDTKEGNVNTEKIKRGAVKISNADSPSFNHLTSSNSGSISSSSSSSSGSGGNSGTSANGAGTTGFKPILPSNVPPFRYIQSGQYQQYLPLTYYQPSHSAAQIAAQYSFQGPPVAHYIQTPTQVQYVSAPSMAHFPVVKYQGFGGDYSTGHDVTSASSSASSTSSVSSQQSSHAQSLSSGVHSTGASVQPNFLYQTPKPVYYQQPLLFFVQPQTSVPNFLYQQPGYNYMKHQQPHQYFAGLQPTSRFVMYPTTHTSQLYLVPMTISSPVGTQESTSGNDLKPSSKGHSVNQQHTTSGNSFAYGNKG
ncbi:hypothetical protein RUM44_014001 [Polyplax serrata]|uniref:Uncharacterized protein n=1 Tax=Polyplax serrata TaxID=468196 RepID=A0ABR1BKE2_POLSC